MQRSSCSSSPYLSLHATDQNYLRQEFLRLLQAERPAGWCDDHNPMQRSLGKARELVGFQLQVISSTVAGGGRGLMVCSGMAPRDSVVSIYPGQLYLSPPQSGHLLDTVGVETLQKPGRSCFQIWHEGACLDGEFADTLPVIQQNMTQYTHGHVINHGPTMAHVNCVVATVEFFPEALPEDCRARLPYTRVPSNPVLVKDGLTGKIYEWPSTQRLKAVVLLAVRDIHAGEELFFDYNLEPDLSNSNWFSNSPYPWWYNKLDDEASI